MFGKEWIHRVLAKQTPRQQGSQKSGIPRIAEICEQRRLLSGFDPATDPNDQISEVTASTPMPNGEAVVNVTLEAGRDINLIAVDLVAGERVAVDVDNANGQPLALRVFDSAGRTVRASFQGRGMGLDNTEDGLDPFLTFVVPKTGTYYVGVSHLANRRFNPVSGADNDNFQRDMPALSAIVTVRSVDRYYVTDTDDQIAEATFIPTVDEKGHALADTTITGTLDDMGDVDMYRISAKQFEVLTLDVFSDGNEDLYLRVFDSTGKQIRANNNSRNRQIESDPKDPYLRFRATYPGDYYVSVSHASNWAFKAIEGTRDRVGTLHGSSDYELVIKNQTAVRDRENAADKDDTIVESTSIGLPSDSPRESFEKTVAATISSHDVDMFSVHLNEGDTLEVETSTASAAGGVDPMIRVFDSDGRLLRNVDHFPNRQRTPTGDALLRYVAKESKVYYVGVSDNGNFRYDATDGTGDTEATRYLPDGTPISATSSVTFRVTPEPGAHDEHDSIDEAIEVRFGDGDFQTRHAILYDQVVAPGEVRLYRIEGQAGQIIAIDVDSTTSRSVDLRLILFDADGNRVREVDNRAANQERSGTTDPYMRIRLPNDGPYYFGISETRNRDYDPTTGRGDREPLAHAQFAKFDLVVLHENLPEQDNDPDDQIGEAIPITNFGEATENSEGRFSQSASSNGEIKTSHDVVMYRVDLERGEQLSVDLTGFGLSARLFDDKATEITSYWRSKSATQRTVKAFAPEDGSYYVGVSAGVNGGYHPGNGLGDLFTSSFESTPFDISFSRISPPGDIDPQDSFDEAIWIGTAPADGYIRTPDRAGVGRMSEVHMWSFNAIEGQELKLAIRSSFASHATDALPGWAQNEGGGKLRLKVYDEARNLVIQSVGFEFDFEVGKTQLYYVAISSPDNNYFDPVTGEKDFTGTNDLDRSVGDYRLVIQNKTDSGPQPDTDAFVGDALTGRFDTDGSWVYEGTINSVDDIDTIFFPAYHQWRLGEQGYPETVIRASDVEKLAFEFVDEAGRVQATMTIDSDGQFNIDDPRRTMFHDDLNAYRDRVRYDTETQALTIPSRNLVRVRAADGVRISTPVEYKILQNAVDNSLSPYDDDDENGRDSDGRIGDAYYDEHNLGKIAIGAEATVTTWINYAEDVDLWKFSADVGDKIEIDIDTNGEVDTRIRVFDERRNLLADVDAATVGSEVDNQLDPGLLFDVPANGTYFVAVSHSSVDEYSLRDGGNSTLPYVEPEQVHGIYTLRVKSQAKPVGPNDDANDAIDEAEIVAIKPTTRERYDQTDQFRGRLDSHDDVAMYRLEIQDAGNYRISVDDMGASTPLVALRLFTRIDGDLVELQRIYIETAEDHWRNDTIQFATNGPETYYLGVSLLENTTYDPETGGNDYGRKRGAVGAFGWSIESEWHVF